MRPLRALSLLAAACGPLPATTRPLPPPPIEGRQLATQPRRLEAGQERTFCWYVNLDNEQAIEVVRMQTAHQGGLHHFNIFASTLDREDGFGPCPDSIELFVGARPILDGSGSDVDYAFPDPLALRLEPRALLIFQLHWINASAAPVEAKWILNLHTVATGDRTLVDIYGFTNLGLELAPRSETVATKECLIEDPMFLLTMSAHFHARGREASAEVERAGAIEPLYRTERWDDPEVMQFEPVIAVSPGDKVRFTCRYRNDGPSTVRYGSSADDEMCFLFGYYYPKLGLVPCF